jgi:hypothetical protein
MVHVVRSLASLPYLGPFSVEPSSHCEGEERSARHRGHRSSDPRGLGRPLRGRRGEVTRTSVACESPEIAQRAVP